MMRFARKKTSLQAIVLAVSSAIVSLGAQSSDVMTKDAFEFTPNEYLFVLQS